MHIDQERPQDELTGSAATSAMSLLFGRVMEFSRPMPRFGRDLDPVEPTPEPTPERPVRFARPRVVTRRGVAHGNATGNRMDIVTATARARTVFDGLASGERINFAEFRRRTGLTWFYAHAALDALGKLGVARSLGLIAGTVNGRVTKPSLHFEKV